MGSIPSRGIQPVFSVEYVEREKEKRCPYTYIGTFPFVDTFAFLLCKIISNFLVIHVFYQHQTRLSNSEIVRLTVSGVISRSHGLTSSLTDSARNQICIISVLYLLDSHIDFVFGAIICHAHCDVSQMPGGGVLPYSLVGGVPLGSRKSCPLLDQILHIL